MFREASLLVDYAIETVQLKERHTEEEAISLLIEMAKAGKIWFPYRRFFAQKPQILFCNLLERDLGVEVENFRLVSYFPRFGLYLPARFRGTPTVISTQEDTYAEVDSVTDFFIEDVRMQAKRYDQEKSIAESWSTSRELFKKALQEEVITPEVLRECIYLTFAETQIFSVSWAKQLVKTILGEDTLNKKWLDISAGWGDRLLTAISLGMRYTGFDPNVALKPGHSEIIDTFGDRTRHHVIYEPFEKGKLPVQEYDLVFTSPPYFDVEEYAPEQEGQSIVEYPSLDLWFVKFLFTSLKKAWNSLKEDGYLILHLSDTKSANLAEATNLFIETYLPNSSWEGVLGVRRAGGPARAVWVWKKTNDQRRWNPKKQRSFTSLFPRLDRLWKLS